MMDRQIIDDMKRLTTRVDGLSVPTTAEAGPMKGVDKDAGASVGVSSKTLVD